MDCDVLVVGGGPAGLSAAWAAAKNGLRVILVEADPKVGLPVRCAEGIGEYLLPFLPFDMPSRLLRWPIKGMIFRGGSSEIKCEGAFWRGFTLDRPEVEAWLERLASGSGAEVFCGAVLESVTKTTRGVSALVRFSGKVKQISAKCLIAADGPDSAVFSQLDPDGFRRREVAEVYSFEAELPNLEAASYEQIFFGDFTYVGYGYFFPKAPKRANVGLGSKCSSSAVESRFNRFAKLDVVARQLDGMTVLSSKSGRGPLSGYRQNLGDTVLFAGDAANQNFKPFLEGILPGMACGFLAGSAAARPDPSAWYARSVSVLFGDLFRASDISYAKMLEYFDSGDLDGLLSFSSHSSGFLSRFIQNAECTGLGLSARLRRLRLGL